MIQMSDHPTFTALVAELQDIVSERNTLRTANEGLKQTNTHLARRNSELSGQIARMSQTWGENVFSSKPLVAPEPITTGPNRPNAKKLTKREVADIRYYKRAGWSNADLANMYDVNPATISRIVRGQYHRNAA